MSKWFLGYLLIMESKGTNLIIACQQGLSESCWPLVTCCCNQPVICKTPKNQTQNTGSFLFLLPHSSFVNLILNPLWWRPHATFSKKPFWPSVTIYNFHSLNNSCIYSLTHPRIHGNIRWAPHLCQAGCWRYKIKYKSFPEGAHSITWKTDTKTGLEWQ